MITKEMVIDQLYDVYDPELGVNVVDLGLIYDVETLDEGKRVNVIMTLTTPGCPMHDSISSGVRNAVHRIEGIELVHVDIVWEPKWTPEMMTDEGKRMLSGF
jgi:metal-sulfur cluster biosynthetic enzyme